ncbi:TetR/AcrR family transcriptional regulator [Streptomyces violens]|uniref:TetR/AcrR family transcriptional regulator n=1 Tax=Streptomyces violens TaxID=66377 RepID=UPI00068D423D|nr:TetR/AcrR family transcriptional regulator [Streptomyces violens]
MQRTAADSAVRERILDTAARLFYAHGVRAIGVDRVVREAEVAKASLYAHFRSKNELVEAYLRREAERSYADMGRVEAMAEAGPGRIEALFDSAAASADAADYQGCCFLNVAAERLDAKSRAADVVAEQKGRLLAHIEASVVRATPAERAEVARVILALFDGAKVASVDEGGAAFVRVKPLAAALAAAPLANS